MRKRRQHDDSNDNALTVADLSETMDNDIEDGPCDSASANFSEIPSTSTGEGVTPNRPLTIKMNFATTSKGRKKKQEALKQAESKIRKLSEVLKSVRR